MNAQRTPLWRTGRFWLAVLAVASSVAALALLAGCASTTATTPAPAAPPTASSSSSSPAAPVPGVPPGGARAGVPVTVTGQDGHAYQVTLTRLVDPARPESPLLAAGPGKRLVAAVFTITGTPAGENANLDATAAGTNGQTYTAFLGPVRGVTNFNSGDVQVPPGGRAVGAVAFEVPAGVRVASVSWAPAGGMTGSQPATWKP